MLKSPGTSTGNVSRDTPSTLRESRQRVSKTPPSQQHLSFTTFPSQNINNNMAPHEDEEDLIDDEPPTCEPYTVLGIEKTATADEIKSAYRKAALKHHPGMSSQFHFQYQASAKI
jgi:DnaJ-domain-containing protein 1